MLSSIPIVFKPMGESSSNPCRENQHGLLTKVPMAYLYIITKKQVKVNSYAETSSAIADRGMGPEIEHTISHNGECPRCGKQFEISGAIYEYPMGALNDDSTIIKWK